MKLTPLDLRQKRFRLALRGFATSEVEGFLEEVAVDLEALTREAMTAREENVNLREQIVRYQEREQTLQEAMVTAHRISEDLKETAKKEAQIIVAGAEAQAEKIVQSAQQRLVQVIADIHELKRQRLQFEAQVRAVIDAHGRLLQEFSRAADEDDDPAYPTGSDTYEGSEDDTDAAARTEDRPEYAAAYRADAEADDGGWSDDYETSDARDAAGSRTDAGGDDRTRTRPADDNLAFLPSKKLGGTDG